ncbi:hypothetical protein [Foetidibacter luteolus]|uniref:hypothetical protein n=1 Tax=Foetidibacter luteolus TaxID=2608880 RepID=UPI00129ABC40|nr:hypothetical protein [Foetidibacter luteolus]
MSVSRAVAIIVAWLFLLVNCSKEYSYEGGSASPLPAIYSLEGSPLACPNTELTGSYTEGTALTPSNTVTLWVNVSRPGSYSISTATVNGIAFSSSGHFTVTGLQQVILQGNGTPASGGVTVVPVNAAGSYCVFEINVTPAESDEPENINLADSAWMFSQGGRSYHGYFDGALTDTVNGSLVVTLVGLVPSKDTAIAVLVDIPGSSTVQKGSYSSLNAVTFTFFDRGGNTLYRADKTTPTAELTVAITAYNAPTQLIEGTFTGTVLNRTNQKVQLTDGKFKAVLNQ